MKKVIILSIILSLTSSYTAIANYTARLKFKPTWITIVPYSSNTSGAKLRRKAKEGKLGIWA
jgi:hypothetical protein